LLLSPKRIPLISDYSAVLLSHCDIRLLIIDADIFCFSFVQLFADGASSRFQRFSPPFSSFLSIALSSAFLSFISAFSCFFFEAVFQL